MRALISPKIASESSEQVRRVRLGVGVLCLQVGDHLRVVLVAQPLVRVDEHVAVVVTGDRSALGDGCGRRRGKLRAYMERRA